MHDFVTARNVHNHRLPCNDLHHKHIWLMTAELLSDNVSGQVWFAILSKKVSVFVNIILCTLILDQHAIISQAIGHPEASRPQI